MRIPAKMSGAVLALSLLATAAGTAAAQTAFEPLDRPLLEGIARTIGDAPLVAFGESSHYLMSIHEFSNTLFRYLVEHKGFRVFMLESAWAANDYLTDFITSDKTEVEGWASFYMNAFGSKPTEQTLLYIRDYNKKHPEDPLQIAGMQPEQPWTDWRELKTALTKAKLELTADIRNVIDRIVFGGQTFVHDIDVISFHGKMSRAKTRILSEADPTDLARALDGLDAFLKNNETAIVAGTSKAAFAEAKLRVLGLRFYGQQVLPMRDFGLVNPNPSKDQVDTLSRNSYNVVDAYRLRIIQTQQETRFKGKKLFIWMHNWHAAKRSEAIDTKLAGAPPLGTTSLGTLLFRALGSSYQVIGSVVANPDFVYKEGQVTLENSFRKFFGDKPGYVDLLHPTPEQKALPLATALPQYSQIDNQIGGEVVLKDQFDGVVFLPKSDLTIGKKK
jgi:erythromycin esterase-like protein